MRDAASLAENLRVLRARQNLNVTEASKKIGITRETLRDLELGTRNPYYPTLRKIAAAYGVPVEGLLLAPTEEHAPLGEAPEEGQQAVTQKLVKLVDGLVEAGNEEALCLLQLVLEEERVRLGEMYVADDPDNGAIRGEYARAAERLAYVGLRLEALRQESGAPDRSGEVSVPLIAEDV